MNENWEPATRTELSAFRVLGYVLITARGENPHPGYVVDIRQSLIRIFPPQFALVRRQLPGLWPQQISPYRYAEVISYPVDQSTVRVHHADGFDDVEIQEAAKQLESFISAIRGSEQRPCPPGAEQATGFSRTFSFDEAFADAQARFPESPDTHPDQLVTLEVLETGALIGGFAGFNHLFVRVSRTIT
jgi:hypothetical protein